MTKEMGQRVREQLEASDTLTREKDLAASVGMTTDAMSRALNGRREFSAAELARVAKALRTSTHWLITGEPDPRAVAVAARHAFNFDRNTHEAPDWDEVEGQLSDVALAYQQVLGEVEHSGALRSAWTAAEVRERLLESSGTDFVDNLANAVETGIGVDVVRIDGIDRAYSLLVGAQPVIVVRETGNWFYQNWSIAHELAHIVAGNLQPLDQRNMVPSADEGVANKFAADLLLPRSELQLIDWQMVTPGALAEFVWKVGVSTDALRRRLGSLGIPMSSRVLSWLSLTTQKLLRQHWVGARGTVDAITERMSRASTRRFPERLVVAHYAAIAAGKLHSVTLAWMLGVEVDELEEEISPRHKAEDGQSDVRLAEIAWLEGELGEPT